MPCNEKKNKKTQSRIEDYKPNIVRYLTNSHIIQVFYMFEQFVHSVSMESFKPALTLSRMEGAKRLYQFFPGNFYTNVGISSKNCLTFCFNPLATLA